MSFDIYNIDVHERYARDRQGVEQYQQQYLPPGDPRAAVAQQTQVRVVTPTPSAITQLLQTNVRKAWALIFPPPHYFSQRQFSRHLAPSLGGDAKHEADVFKIDTFLRQTRSTEKVEIQKEADALKKMRNLVKTQNDLADYIIARMNQYLPG